MQVMAVCGRPGAPYKPAVRVLSVLCALLLMYVYSLTKVPTTVEKSSQAPRDAIRISHLAEKIKESSPHESFNTIPKGSILLGRHLLSEDLGGGVGDEDNGTECSSPRDEHNGYNSSCDYVLDQCGGEAQLFDYLRFVTCDLKHAQVSEYMTLLYCNF